MTASRAERNQDGRDQGKRNQRRTFAGIGYAFVVVMAGTTLPTPLYPLYRSSFGLSALMVTIVYAAYAVGVLAALLGFGQASDRIGRKRALLPGLAMSAASAVVFLLAGGLPALFVGRVISGLSAGIFTGTATATLLDLAPGGRRHRAAEVATLVNIGGLGLGPLLAGAVSEYVGWPLRTTFVVDLILLVPAVIAVAVMPEPVTDRTPYRFQITSLRVPAGGLSTFVRASVAGFAGFVVMGLFSAVVPTALGELMGEHNRAIIGVVVFVIFAASLAGQQLTPYVGPDRALPVGCAILIAGMAVLAGALGWKSLLLLIVAAVVAGVGQGMAFRAGLAAVGALAPPESRAAVTSAFFVVLYIALSIPVVAVGFAARSYGVRDAGLVTCAAVALLAAAAAASLARPRRTAPVLD
ncbi:MAG: MFS transporter [Mycobacteriales bacterium]